MCFVLTVNRVYIAFFSAHIETLLTKRGKEAVERPRKPRGGKCLKMTELDFVTYFIKSVSLHT